MSDEDILAKGGGDYEIHKYAEQNGADMNQQESKTPETDEEFDRLRFVVEPAYEHGISQRDEVVFGMRDFARQLEIQRNEARAKCDEWQLRFEDEQASELCIVCKQKYSPSIIESGHCIFCIAKDFKSQLTQWQECAKQLHGTLHNLKECISKVPEMNHQKYDLMGIQVNAALTHYNKLKGEKE